MIPLERLFAFQFTLLLKGGFFYKQVFTIALPINVLVTTQHLSLGLLSNVFTFTTNTRNTFRALIYRFSLLILFFKGGFFEKSFLLWHHLSIFVDDSTASLFLGLQSNVFTFTTNTRDTFGTIICRFSLLIL